MSAFEVSDIRLGMNFPAQPERPFTLSYDDILDDKVPVDEIKTHMVPAQVVIRLLKEVKFHLLMKVEAIALKGTCTEEEIDKLYVLTDESIGDFEQINPNAIDEDTLMELVQKARSAYKELQELQNGNRALFDRLALSERIKSYISHSAVTETAAVRLR